MKMCLAPCFKGCSDEEYAAEVARVQEFFETGGQSLVREIEQQRDDASANLDFEGAAALHTRLEKVKAAASQLPEIVRRLDELNGVMIQPRAGARNRLRYSRSRRAMICDPVSLDVGKQTRTRSTWRQAAVDGVAHHASARCRPTSKLRSALEWMEHLAMLKRWYYRTAKSASCFWRTTVSCRCGEWCAEYRASFVARKPAAT